MSLFQVSCDVIYVSSFWQGKKDRVREGDKDGKVRNKELFVTV